MKNILNSKNLKSHKYPINVLRDCFGAMITRKNIYALKSSKKYNYLSEQIFEVIICPYISREEQCFLRYYYKDYLTFNEIAEKENQREADVKEIIESAVLKLREHHEIAYILQENPIDFSHRIRTHNSEHYGKGYLDGVSMGYKEGYKEGLKKAQEKAQKIADKESYQKGFNEGYEAGVLDTTKQLTRHDPLSENKSTINVEALPAISLEELKLSVRAYNCLKRAGINTLKELALLTPKELFGIKNLGRKSCLEIISVLRSYEIDTTIYESK